MLEQGPAGISSRHQLGKHRLGGEEGDSRLPALPATGSGICQQFPG